MLPSLVERIKNILSFIMYQDVEETVVEYKEQLPDLPEGKINSMVCTYNDYIYVGGGWDENNNVTSTFYRLDLKTNVWERLQDLPYNCVDGRLIPLIDGRIVLLLGYDGTSARTDTYIYNPVTNTWTQRTPAPVALYRHGACLIPNGNILVACGLDSSNQSSNVSMEYNWVTDTWEQATDGFGYYNIYGTFYERNSSMLDITINENGHVVALSDYVEIYIYDYINKKWNLYNWNLDSYYSIWNVYGIGTTYGYTDRQYFIYIGKNGYSFVFGGEDFVTRTRYLIERFPKTDVEKAKYITSTFGNYVPIYKSDFGDNRFPSFAKLKDMEVVKVGGTLTPTKVEILRYIVSV